MAPPRRISYVIPSPTGTPPKLVLPTLHTQRRGRTVPLVIQDPNQPPASNLNPFLASPHPHTPSDASTQHRLGVSALAIDLSTQLTGRSNPEGLLYSAGRDGLVISWEIGVPTRPRVRQGRNGRHSQGARRTMGPSWRSMTGWDDEDDEVSEDEDLGSKSESEEEEDTPYSTSARNGTDPSRLGPRGVDPRLPYERRWEVDHSKVPSAQPRSAFRQCIQSHNDWINDITLCNLNQTVISASNDGTVKVWSPHDPSLSSSPTLIGKHADYVRCLAHSTQQPWVASGSFDRSIKLWDISRGSNNSLSAPISNLSLVDTSSKSSVYALATDFSGNMIASGSPERVVRIWDPRAGKRVGKLLGHTDNIRTLLISDDGKYLMSGSSDATIKIWSLATQRCLHTFAHHTDSVWSLFSSHSSLSVFYSGDRSGYVCKVDMENCADISEGECVVLCHDDPSESESEGHAKAAPRGREGITKLVALDDWGVWTTTGSSDIKRWRDPGRRKDRMALNADDYEYSTSVHDTFGFAPLRGVERSPTPNPNLRSLSDSPDASLSDPPTTNVNGSPSRKHVRSSVQSTVSNKSIPSTEDPLGQDAHGDALSLTLYGVPFDSLVRLAPPNEGYTFTNRGGGAGRDPDVATLYSAASVKSVPVLHIRPNPTPQSATTTFPPLSPHAESSSNTRTALGSPTRSEPLPDANASRTAYEARELAFEATPLCPSPEEVLKGSHGIVRAVILNDRIHALTVDTAGEVSIWDLVRGVCRGYWSSEDVENASFGEDSQNGSGGAEWSPRESLEAVKERIEGEAMIASWATVDTKMGSLTVHMKEGTCFDAEVYADEAGFAPGTYSDEQRLNLGRWVLANLFSGFIRAQIQLASFHKSTGGDESSSPIISPTRGIHRSPAPNHISFDSLKGRRLRSNSDLTVMTSRTPGITLAMTTPAMSPAVIPDMPSLPVPSTPSLSAGAPHSRPMGLGLGLTSDLSTIPASPNPPGSPTPRAYLPTSPRPAQDLVKSHNDYFSLRTSRLIEHETAESASAATPAGDQTPGGFTAKTVETPGPPPTPSGGRALMGKLRNFGKVKKSNPAESVSSPVPASEGPVEEDTESLKAAKAHSQLLEGLHAQPLQPPSVLDAPPVNLLPDVAIIISEQPPGESSWATIYHGLVSTTEQDVDSIEAVAPFWLLEYLLTNKVSQQTTVKISFSVVRWGKIPDDPLPELLGSQAKLTASRVLRVRKVLLYILEKLDQQVTSAAATPTPATQGQTPAVLSATTSPAVNGSETAKDSEPPVSAPTTTTTGITPSSSYLSSEDMYEIICNDVVLPMNMTLAAVRHYVWRSSSDLVLGYRKKGSGTTGNGSV